jgi:hypothetical protein
VQCREDATVVLYEHRRERASVVDCKQMREGTSMNTRGKGLVLYSVNRKGRD